MSVIKEIIGKFSAGSFPRKLYNSRRISYYSKCDMTEEDIRSCENNESIIGNVLEKYERIQPDIVKRNYEIIDHSFYKHHTSIPYRI